MLLDDTSARPLVAGVGHIAHDLTGVRHVLSGQPSMGKLACIKLIRSGRRTADDPAALIASRKSEAVALRRSSTTQSSDGAATATDGWLNPSTSSLDLLMAGRLAGSRVA